MKPTRSRTILTAVIAILLLTGLVGGSRADAYDLGYFAADGVAIRTDPYLTATVIGLGYTGQDTCQYYIVQGDYANGNPYWWYHHRAPTALGYSHVSYLGTYYPAQNCT